MFEFLKNLLANVGEGPGWNSAAPDEAGQDQEPSSEGGFTDFTAEAAARITAVISQQFDYVVYQPLPAHGRVLANGEVAAENTDGTLSLVTCATRLVTSSGAVVSPYQVRLKCGHPGCGQVEAVLLQCAVCGAARCYLHCRRVTVQGKEAIYCEEHLVQVLREWDTWREYDFARGITRPTLGEPSEPLAAKGPPPWLTVYHHEPPRRHQATDRESAATRID